jgi:hypothetical protein
MAGITHPRDPNCGLVEATDSIPQRTHMGPAANNTNSIPIMLPAASVRLP